MQPFLCRGVVLWDVVREQAGLPGGADASGLEHILQTIWDTVHGSAGAQPYDLGFGRASLGTRPIGGHRHETAQPIVNRIDPGQRGLDQIDR